MAMTEGQRMAWLALPNDAWRYRTNVPDDILRVRHCNAVYSLGSLVAERTDYGVETTDRSGPIPWTILYGWEWLSCKTGLWKPCRKELAEVKASAELLPYQIEVNRLLDELESRIETAIGNAPQSADEGLKMFQKDQIAHRAECTKIEVIFTRLREIYDASCPVSS